MTFRPDYEVPLGAVLDDLGRRCPTSTPTGWRWPARASAPTSPPASAATDARVRALVANPPVVDMSRYMEAWVGHRGLPDDPGHPARGRHRRARGPDAPPDAVGDRGHLPPVRRAVLPRLARRHGAPTGWATWSSAIRCPVLALIGDREGAEPRAQFDALRRRGRGPGDPGASSRPRTGPRPTASPTTSGSRPRSPSTGWTEQFG